MKPITRRAPRHSPSRLRNTLLAAADVKANPVAVPLMVKAARMLNKLGADFRWQHLPVPFEVYSDGIDLPAYA